MYVCMYVCMVEHGERIGIACEQCGRICLSKAGLRSHQKTHQTRESQRINYTLTQDSACKECGKICKSAGGLKRHRMVHNNTLAAPKAKKALAFNICARECKSLAGLKSHFRAAHG